MPAIGSFLWLLSHSRLDSTCTPSVPCWVCGGEGNSTPGSLSRQQIKAWLFLMFEIRGVPLHWGWVRLLCQRSDVTSTTPQRILWDTSGISDVCPIITLSPFCTVSPKVVMPPIDNFETCFSLLTDDKWNAPFTYGKLSSCLFSNLPTIHCQPPTI